MENFKQSLAEKSFNVSAATATGPHHLSRGEENQDSFAVLDYGSGSEAFLALAVADGAGSLAYSKEGATIAAEATVSACADLVLKARKENFEIDISSLAIEAIVKARKTVKSLDYWKEAGSTLTVFLAVDNTFVAAAVGDSFIVLQNNNEELHLVQPPAVGEFANITQLLTSKEFTIDLVHGNLEDLRAVALCSDAFEHATLQNSAETVTPVEGFWGNIFSMASQSRLEASELISFMDSQGKIDDDATIVVAASAGEFEKTISSDFIRETFNYPLHEDSSENEDSDQWIGEANSSPAETAGLPRNF